MIDQALPASVYQDGNREVSDTGIVLSKLIAITAPPRNGRV